MAAASIALSVSKGDALQVNATHVVSSTDSTPVDITGWTIAVDIRRHLNDGSVDATIAATIVSGVAGTYTFTLTATITRALVAATHYLSIFRTNSGSEREMAEGTLVVAGNARYGS